LRNSEKLSEVAIGHTNHYSNSQVQWKNLRICKKCVIQSKCGGNSSNVSCNCLLGSLCNGAKYIMLKILFKDRLIKKMDEVLSSNLWWSIK